MKRENTNGSFFAQPQAANLAHFPGQGNHGSSFSSANYLSASQQQAYPLQLSFSTSNSNINTSMVKSSSSYYTHQGSPHIKVSSADISSHSVHHHHNMSSMDDLVGETGLDDAKMHSNLKLKYYNKALISYLSQQGLNINPLKLNARHIKEKYYDLSKPLSSTLSSNSNIETFITGNGQILFLPFNPQKKKRRRNNIRDEYNDDDDHHDDNNDDNDDNDNDNDDDNDNANDNENEEADEAYEPSDIAFSPRSQSSILNNDIPTPTPYQPDATYSHPSLAQAISSVTTSDQTHNITNHTFSVIVKLNKKCSLNKIVKVNYHTHLSIHLIPSEYSKKEPIDERFRTSELIEWSLDLSNPDCYIPFKEFSALNKSIIDDSMDMTNADTNTLDDSVESDSISLDSISNNLTTNSPSKKTLLDAKFSSDPTQSIKTFKSLNPKEYVNESTLLNNETMIESNLFKNKQAQNQQSSDSFQPGYYIFLLPVVYPLNTPESIQVPHASHEHQFSIQIQKATVVVPTLQAPQSAFLSTSPGHHFKYEDQNFDFSSHNPLTSMSPIISPPSSNLNGSSHKSSFFKKIGIHKSSSTSKKFESSSPKNSLSPKGSYSSTTLNSATSNPRTRSNSTNNHPISSNLVHHSTSGSSTFNGSSQNNPIVYNYSYKLPAVRLPPSDATSTLNKSIYVNKVWNKALNYELLLPKKFTQLSPPNGMTISPNDKFLKSNTFLLQMKLIPLVKNLQLKRIKVNIVEKITYTPKAAAGCQTKKIKSRSTDRTITMLEIKTKDKPNPNLNINKPSTPLKTQIIKGCTNDNLLTFCYNNEKSSCFKENSTLPASPPSAHYSVLGNHNSHSRSNSGGASSLKAATGKKISRIFDNPLSLHNTIANSYGTNSASSHTSHTQTQEDVTITNPVKLQCPLNFIANDQGRFISTVYENLCTGTSDLTGLHDGSDFVDKTNDTMSIFSVGSNGNERGDAFSDDDGTSLSPVRRHRNLSLSSANTFNSRPTINNNSNWNIPTVPHDEYSLYNSHTFLPDVTNNNLKVRHRLQISFRISRPDTKVKGPDGEFKMHHYEVIVDTPIVFVSPFCITDTLDLPSYEDAVRIGMFEVVKNSSRFAMSQATSNDYDSSYGYDNSSEENAVFIPCSPLMSDNIPFPINQNHLNSNAQYTNQLATSITSAMSSLPAYENYDPSPRKRSDSGYLSLPGTTPMNATSLLSAAFTRSKEGSKSLNSVLANDLSNLSLGSSTGVRNTIDGVINVSNEVLPPPEYTEIGFKSPTMLNVSTTTSEVSTPGIMSPRNNSLTTNNINVNPPEETTDEHSATRNKLNTNTLNVPGTVNNENITIKKMPSFQRLNTNSSELQTLPGSRTSLKSERVALLNESDGYKGSIRNSTTESLMSIEDTSFDLGDRTELDSIINMNIGNIPTLNLTPTQHGI